MTIAGELTIDISCKDKKLQTSIKSTRPIQAASVFSGKTISQTVNMIPLVFSVCAKAQTVTAIRAIEGALSIGQSKHVESLRESLILLENLKEQALRVAIDWPVYINEAADKALLSHINMGIVGLMQTLLATGVMAVDAKQVNDYSHNEAKKQWQLFSERLSQAVFGLSAYNWLEISTNKEQLENWSKKQSTIAARFIDWLDQQPWKHSGQSTIAPLLAVSDEELFAKLKQAGYEYTAQPDWNNCCYEVSWFSRTQTSGSQSEGGITKNDIMSRMLARLKEIAGLMVQLDSFYKNTERFSVKPSSVKGMAHSDAARGRLTHVIELDTNNSTVNNLLILAPTEWNFHPQGVAASSLNNLHIQQDSIEDIRKQAELLIHAIDPCVGYQLNISG